MSTLRRHRWSGDEGVTAGEDRSLRTLETRSGGEGLRQDALGRSEDQAQDVVAPAGHAQELRRLSCSRQTSPRKSGWLANWSPTESRASNNPEVRRRRCGRSGLWLWSLLHRPIRPGVSHPPWAPLGAHRSFRVPDRAQRETRGPKPSRFTGQPFAPQVSLKCERAESRRPVPGSNHGRRSGRALGLGFAPAGPLLLNRPLLLCRRWRRCRRLGRLDQREVLASRPFECVVQRPDLSPPVSADVLQEGEGEGAVGAFGLKVDGQGRRDRVRVHGADAKSRPGAGQTGSPP